MILVLLGICHLDKSYKRLTIEIIMDLKLFFDCSQKVVILLEKNS